MPGIRHPEFLRELENTKYPFIPTATLSNGTQAFLEGTFLDAHLYAIDGSRRYYLSGVDITSSDMTIIIGDVDAPEKLTGKVTLPASAEVISLQDAYGRPGGVLISEPPRLSMLTAWGTGNHRFEREQTEFCVTCQLPAADPGVTGILLDSGELLTGEVWLIGGDGVVITLEGGQGEGVLPDAKIEVNVVGDPLFLQRLCNPEELFFPVNPVRVVRIRQGEYTYDCLPDDYGNFSIQMNDALAPDAALRIRTTPAGILLEVEGTTNAGKT